MSRSQPAMTRGLEVLLIFLRLGCTSFGGPVAHIGYFRTEFVERRRWVSEAGFADLVALCQFMPGPASSQLGMSLGLLREGPLGMFAAWIGFTLPSALLMLAFANGVQALGDVGNADWLKGLKLVAVAVVAQAVWGMTQSLAPDRPRATLAVTRACRWTVAHVLATSSLQQAGFWFALQTLPRRVTHRAVLASATAVGLSSMIVTAAMSRSRACAK